MTCPVVELGDPQMATRLHSPGPMLAEAGAECVNLLASVPWSSWERAQVLECLIYLRGSSRVKIPEAWQEAMPTLEELQAL